MKRLGISTAIVVCLASPAFAQVAEVGVNAAVKGDVTIESQGQAAKQALVKQAVYLGDAINSSKLASLQVLLKDETVFTVGPECELTIDRFVYDPQDNSNSLKASVKKGMFRFMSGNVSKSGPDAVSIDTPVASLGVRGTIVEGLVGRDAIALARSMGLISADMQVDPDGATLFVLRGPGQARKGRDRKGEITVTSGGGSVTLNQSGQAVFVASADAAPTAPTVLPEDAFDLFNDRLRTAPTGGPDLDPFAPDIFVMPPKQRPKDPIDGTDIFQPEDMDWPEEDIFSNPCGVTICP